MSGIDLCGIELRHPVLNASGTFDAVAAIEVFGEIVIQEFPFSAFVTKTVTPEPRTGNPPPRLWEEAHGLVNSIGLPNKGLEGFQSEDLPQLERLPVPLIVSVMSHSMDGFGDLISSLDSVESISGFELNVSCPNVESGLVVGESPDETSRLLDRVRPLSSKPMIVKLSSSIDPGPVAQAAESAGADAVSLVNTLAVAPISPSGRGPWLGGESGGLSGPALRSAALGQVAEVVSSVAIPVVGMGGIETGEDAVAMLSAGARVVAVGTENFRDPIAARRIADEISLATATKSRRSSSGSR